MEVRNLVISYDEQKCRIGGQKGTLKSIYIVETLPNGKQKTVHSDFHFVSQEKTPVFNNLLKLIKKPEKASGRRAA